MSTVDELRCALATDCDLRECDDPSIFNGSRKSPVQSHIFFKKIFLHFYISLLFSIFGQIHVFGGNIILVATRDVLKKFDVFMPTVHNTRSITQMMQMNWNVMVSLRNRKQMSRS